MPATSKEAASVFFGATALESRRTPEWTSCANLSALSRYGEAGWKSGPGGAEEGTW